MTRMPNPAPIPVVVVGFGRMGRLHARTCARMPEFRLRGVVDPDPACASLAAGMMLDAYPRIGLIPDDVRLAIVAAPSTRHAQVFADIAARGLDCLIEKPVGANLAELESIADIASAAGLQVFAGYSERFNAAMPDIARALQPSCAGPHDRRASAQYTRDIVVRRFSSAAFARAFDTDVLYDLVSHDVDWMLHAIGEEPTSMSIQSADYRAGRLEAVTCTFDFPHGTRVRLAASRIARSEERSITVIEHDGVGNTFHLASPAWTHTREDPLTAQARALARALRGENTAIARIHDAIRVQRLLRRLEVSLPTVSGSIAQAVHVG